MILRELGDYLALHKKVSRRALARHFHTSEDAVEAMLGVWMRKGRVAKRESSLCGGSCCGKHEEVTFEWCEPGQIGLIQKG
ncbi:FeoC-like transcriptional regulator [Aeromonas caviae]|uniref:FeoC-like transcriptional regulator n=1 Tax=Aeromonas caviae TaxID=648 RepID=UPI002B474289|nr:FeoC-like transcriptional regulator [Aeromonas caviae]